jgi:hypothetical protein
LIMGGSHFRLFVPDPAEAAADGAAEQLPRVDFMKTFRSKFTN